MRKKLFVLFLIVAVASASAFAMGVTEPAKIEKV